MGFEDSAKAFEKLYPGITIKFVNSNTYGSTQWYQTEAAGGQLPDVSWVQSQTVNSALPKGVFTNLAPYFNQPDPYIQGNCPRCRLRCDAGLLEQRLVVIEGGTDPVPIDHVLFVARGLPP